jgi:hypothetical protein
MVVNKAAFRLTSSRGSESNLSLSLVGVVILVLCGAPLLASFSSSSKYSAVGLPVGRFTFQLTPFASNRVMRVLVLNLHDLFTAT